MKKGSIDLSGLYLGEVNIKSYKKEKIMNLLEKGHRRETIIKKCKTSESYVRRIATSNSFKKDRGRISTEKGLLILKKYLSGRKITTIANELDVSIKTVDNIIKAAKSINFPGVK